MSLPKSDISVFRGRWALVTGASSGIGRAIAEELARAGAHLLLSARRIDRLDELAARLKAEHGIDVATVAADLDSATAPMAIHAFALAAGLRIDILVNNAGLTRYGAFVGSDLAGQLRMVQVHCSAVLHLTHLFLKEMVERKRGHVLIVATTTLAPAPYMTTYAATKGFDLLFSEGLAEEVAPHGVVVSALCPGPTRSELVEGLEGATDEQHAQMQSAESVARAAVQGLAAGTRCIRPSFAAWVIANMPRCLPRKTVSGMTERFYRPKSR